MSDFVVNNSLENANSALNVKLGSSEKSTPLEKKRKHSELTNNEKMHAVEELEKELHDEFERAHGEKTRRLVNAEKQVKDALAMLQRAVEVISDGSRGGMEDAVVERIYKEFDAIYPPVEVSQAFKQRNPQLFGLCDLRSEAKKKNDEKMHDRDEIVRQALLDRTKAVSLLNDRISKRFQQYNNALSTIRSASFVFRPGPNDLLYEHFVPKK